MEKLHPHRRQQREIHQAGGELEHHQKGEGEGCPADLAARRSRLDTAAVTRSRVPTATASSGWSTRSRSTHVRPGRDVLAEALASERAGKSVSPSAATAPLTPRTTSPATPRESALPPLPDLVAETADARCPCTVSVTTREQKEGVHQVQFP
jgi:hypothetical protein